MPASNVEILDVMMEELTVNFEEDGIIQSGVTGSGELEMIIVNDGPLHPLVGAPVYCTIKLNKVYSTGYINNDENESMFDREEGKYTLTFVENETLNIGLLGSLNNEITSVEFDINFDGFERYSDISGEYAARTSMLKRYCPSYDKNPHKIKVDYEVNTIFGSAGYNDDYSEEKMQDEFSGNMCDTYYENFWQYE